MNARFLVLLLLLAAPLPATAQGTPEQRIAAARAQAQAAGLPVQLLDTKVAEGRAKGVPADRIAGAVERRLRSVTRAREALRRMQRASGPTAEELSVAADAIEAGVEGDVIAALADDTPPAQSAVALAVLTQMVRAGTPPQQALRAVRAAVARGPDALRSLPGEAARPGPDNAADPGFRGRARERGEAAPDERLTRPAKGGGGARVPPGSRTGAAPSSLY